MATIAAKFTSIGLAAIRALQGFPPPFTSLGLIVINSWIIGFSCMIREFLHAWRLKGTCVITDRIFVIKIAETLGKSGPWRVKWLTVVDEN
jgi:hypothetical protein